MKTIQLQDLTFNISIPESEIIKSIDRIAKQITHDCNGKKPLFIVVLNGAFMFASDLFKRVEIEAEISFIRVASYEGTESSGKTKQILGLKEEIKGRNVVIVEDIIDSGFTMKNIIEDLEKKGAAEIRVATLFFKPDALKYPLNIDYVAMEIPDDFIVGYGLDYNGIGRNLKDIYVLSQG